MGITRRSKPRRDVLASSTPPLGEDNNPQRLDAATDAGDLHHVVERHGPGWRRFPGTVEGRTRPTLPERPGDLSVIDPRMPDQQQQYSITIGQPGHRHVAPARALPGRTVPESTASTASAGDRRAETSR